jgi:Rha family phage regulatory protein
MKTDWVVINAENRPVTTSRMVSEVFGELHKNIVAKIEMMDFSSDFFCENFNEVKYITEHWNSKSAYEMTRDGFAFISMGFAGKSATEFSLAYLDAFDEVVNMPRDRNTIIHASCQLSHR